MKRQSVTAHFLPLLILWTVLMLLFSAGASADSLLVLPASLETIESEAFRGDSSIEKVVIPDGTQSIGELAFAYCPKLWCVVIPESVTHIAANAFEGSPLVSIRSTDDAYACGYAEEHSLVYRSESNGYSGLAGENVYYTFRSGVLTLSGFGSMTQYSKASAYPWYHIRDLIETVVVREGIETIGPSAFEDCDSLTDVQLPESLYFVGRNALAGCRQTVRIHAGDESYAAEWAVKQGFDFCAALRIAGYPESVQFFDQERISMTVEAYGTDLKYLWEVRPAGEEKWYKLYGLSYPNLDPASLTDTWTDQMDYSMDGWSYRCTVTDAFGSSLITAPIPVYLRKTAVILQDPESIRGALGSQASFSVEAEGDGLTYQWQQRSYVNFASDTWRNIPSAHSPHLNFTIKSANNCYRCVVTDEYGQSAVSFPAHITLEISVKSPDDVTVNAGETAVFTIGASGTGLKMQWQVLHPGEAVWKDVQGLSGAATHSLSFTASAYSSGNRYRCKVTDENGDVEYSGSALLTVNVPVTGLALSDSELTLDVQSTKRLTAAVRPANASNQRITWSSNNPGIVSVSETGLLISGSAEGAATITATSDDGGFSQSCTVTVVNYLSLAEIGLSTDRLACGASAEFTCSYLGGVRPYSLGLSLWKMGSSQTPVKTFSYTGDRSSYTVGFSFTQPGLYYLTAELTDATGKTVSAASKYLSVIRKASGVRLNASSLTMKKGDTFTLAATVLPQDASDQSVVWSVENPSVAECADGVITALNGGRTIVSVRTVDGGFTAACEIVVTVPAAGIELKPGALTLQKGQTASLQASVLPSDATNRTVSWTSSNSAVASVQNGVVKALSKGQATITAQSADGGFTAACTVTVEVPASGIVLSQNSLTLETGETHRLTASVLPADASDPSVSWRSSNPAVAAVSDGVVRAVGAGSAVIYASGSSGLYTASCTVTVFDGLAVSGITLSSTDVCVTDTDFRFNVNVIGGVKPYTLQFDIYKQGVSESLGHAVTGGVSEETHPVTVNFTESGTYYLSVLVTDAHGNTAQLNSPDVVVRPALNICSVSTSALTLNIGETFTASASVEGGRQPYTLRMELYSGSEMVEYAQWSDSTKTSYEWSGILPGATGSYYVKVLLTDAAGESVSAYSDNITVGKVYSSRIETNLTDMTLKVGDSFPFTLSLYPQNVSDTGVTASFDTSILHMDVSSMTLTALRPGQTTLLLEANDGGCSLSFAITVVEAVKPSAGGMTISDAGVRFIANFERFSSTPYDDGGGTWTIGYGHTDGVDVDTAPITEAQALEYLRQDLSRAMTVVNDFLNSRGIVVSQNQYDALVSLAFNIEEPFYKSCRLSRLMEKYACSTGAIPSDEVWECFATWHHDTINGAKLDILGLFLRRMCEARIFISGNYTRKDDWSIPSWFKEDAVGSEVPDGWIPVEYGGTDRPVVSEDFLYGARLLELNSSAYAYCYATTSGVVVPYTSEYLNVRGTVEGGASSSSYIDGAQDELWLLGAGVTNGNHWAKVSYPVGTSGSRRTAYVHLSDLIAGRLNSSAAASSKYYVADRRGEDTNPAHYVAPGDVVWTLAEDSNYRQILYPVSGGKYRIAWVAKQNAPVTQGSYNDILKNLSESAPAYCYAYTDGSVPAYTDNTLRWRGNVERGEYSASITSATDEVYIYQVGRTNEQNWAYVSYPAGSRRYTAYVRLEDLIPGSYNESKLSKLQYYVSDRRGGLPNPSHWVDVGDRVYLLSRDDQARLCQILYPVSGGKYRIGWCTLDEYNSVAPKPDVSGDLIFGYAAPAQSYYYNDLKGNGERENALNAVLKQYGYTASSLASVNRMVVFIEGYGETLSVSGKCTALGVVLSKGKVIFASDRCATLPDYPFDSAGNHTKSDRRSTDVGTLVDGQYTATSKNHKEKYPALGVNSTYAVRIHVGSSSSDAHDRGAGKCPLNHGYTEMSMNYSGINIHRASSKTNGSLGSIPNSAGCINVYKDDYDMFAAAAGFAKVSSSAVPAAASTSGTGSLVSGVTVDLIVSRAYAYNNKPAFRSMLISKYTRDGVFYSDALNAILSGSKSYCK